MRCKDAKTEPGRVLDLIAERHGERYLVTLLAGHIHALPKRQSSSHPASRCGGDDESRTSGYRAGERFTNWAIIERPKPSNLLASVCEARIACVQSISPAPPPPSSCGDVSCRALPCDRLPLFPLPARCPTHLRDDLDICDKHKNNAHKRKGEYQTMRV